MTKEFLLSQHSVVINGEVLPLDDDKVSDSESYHQRNIDIDADLLGYAQRTAPKVTTFNSDYKIPLNTQDLRQAIEDRDMISTGGVHVKAMSVLHEFANEENRLRSFGASAAEIARKVDTPLRVSHMKLGFDKTIDRSNMFPPNSRFIEIEDDEDVDANVHTIKFHREKRASEEKARPLDARESAYKD